MSKKAPLCFQIGWNACIQCGACIAVCPQGPEFISNFNTIAVDTSCDIACMNCEKICPVSTISHYATPIEKIDSKHLSSYHPN